MGQLIYVPNTGIPSGGVNLNVRTVVGDAVQVLSDDILLIDASLGLATVTLLPTAQILKRISVKKIDATANIVRIVPAGGSLIDTEVNAEINVPYTSIDFIGDGSNLWVL